MKRSLIAAVALSGIGALALPATAAYAATTATLSTSTVKLSPTSHVNLTVNVDFGTCIQDSFIDIESAGGTDGDYREITDDADGKVSGTFSFNASAVPGTWYVSASALTCDDQIIDDADIKTFSVKRPTAISKLNAAPEPVKKGKTITVSGYIKRMDPYAADGPGYVASKGTTVRIEFKAKGTTAWKLMGTAKSASTGKFVKGFTASKDGYWRASYVGNTTHAPSTSGTDYVDVK